MIEKKVKTSIKSGFKWSLIGNYSAQVIGFVVSIFLARILTPEDFGIVGMSLAFIHMLKILMTFGFNEALIQNDTTSKLTFSSVFYINVFVGVVVSTLLIISAPYIADFYNRKVLTGLIRILSIIYLLESLNMVQTTILKKSLDFKILTFRSLISQSIAGIGAIVLALNGFGLYALVAQHIFASLFKTFLLWKISDWKPSLEFSFSEVKKLLSFAVYSFFGQFLGKIIKEVNTLFIAKVFSPSILGFYSRADSFSNLIAQNSSNSLRQVMFSSLSLLQKDDLKFNKMYSRVYNVVITASFFLSSLAFITGAFLITNIYGEKWIPSIVIFKILMIKGIALPHNGIIVTAILSKGYAKKNFQFGNIKKLINIIPLLTLYFKDLNIFLYAVLFTTISNIFVNMFISFKILKVSYFEQMKPLLMNFIFSLTMLLGLPMFVKFESNYIEVFIQALLYIGFFALFTFLLNKEVMIEIKQILDRNKKKGL